MSIKMLHDFVLVKADEAKDETAGGIVLTVAGMDKPHTGTVISVGPGKRDLHGNLVEHGIQDGDTVIFGETALNQPLKHDGEEFHVMRAEMIFGVQK